MAPMKSDRSPFFAGVLQFDVKSGDIESNLARVKKGLKMIAESHERISPGIVVMPELWATGFAYDVLPELTKAVPALLENLHGLAEQYQVLLAGSLPESDNGVYYNTLYISGPAGNVGVYRKQRLFTPMAEDTFFTQGSDPCPVQTSLGPVAGLVCYDLRFPELLRQQTARGADILVVPAQWPAARVNHWRILLQARAIENQMFVIAANRCGTTGDTTFGGHSMIIGPDGSILLEAQSEEEFRGMILKPELLTSARSLFSTIPHHHN